MIRLFFLLSLLALISQEKAIGQEILFSKPQKIPSKISEYDILDKTKDGLMVYKWGEKTHLIELFDPNSLALKWSKEIVLPSKKSKVIEVISYPEALVIFYTQRIKNISYLYARKTDLNLAPLQEDILLDTLVKRISDFPPKYIIKIAKNKKYLAVLRQNYDFTGLSSVNYTLLDKQLSKVNTAVSQVAQDSRIQNTLLDNKGNMLIAYVNKQQGLFNNTSLLNEINIWMSIKETGATRDLRLDNFEHLLSDVHLELDNLNHKILLTGFFNKKQTNMASGYCYLAFDWQTEKLGNLMYQEFSRDFIPRLLNNRATKNKATIANLEIKETISRKDGGVLLVGESAYTTQQSILRSAFDTYSTQQVNQITTYYHENILVLSINPDGTLFWGNVLQKKQYSEADDGYFSSFGIMLEKKQLNFVFNEDISRKTNVSTYELQSDGQYTIKYLCNVKDYKVMVAPKYAKQLSYNEMIIPAFNSKDDFLLLKITFKDK